MNGKLPRVTKLKNGMCYITLYTGCKRIRVYNGKKYGIDINPNVLPQRKRFAAAKKLAFEVYSRGALTPTICGCLLKTHTLYNIG